MGIEFAYAAETAFVSPTLLKIGEYVYYIIHHGIGVFYRGRGGCFFLQNFGEKRDQFLENPHKSKEYVVWHHVPKRLSQVF